MATRLRQANLKPKKEEATVNKKLKTIDHSMKTITVSKDFLQKAGQFGTPEFREALLMKEDFPDYMDLCQYFGQKKLKYYADFFSSSSSLCCGVI